MFKILTVSTLFFFVLATATDLACKSQTSPAIGGVCPSDQTFVGGENCCEAADVYNVAAYACRSDPMPDIGGFCPDGFIRVSEGCCEASDSYSKKQ